MTPHEFGRYLCKIVDVPHDRVQRITLNVAAEQYPTIDIVMVPTAAQFNELGDLISEVKWVKMDETES